MDALRRGAVDVLDSHLAWVEAGDGPTIVFLHGNPTSSFLWRNVIGPVAADGWRCVAVDLIGMGASGRPPVGYRLADHVRYVEAFLDTLGSAPVVLVGHDWGAVIALDITGRRPDLVRATAFLEGHLHPIANWDSMDEGGRELFSALRRPGEGERLVHEENVMIEVVLQAGTLRTLAPEELDAYRKPFLRPEDRGPMLAWTREIPVADDPPDVAALIRTNQAVLRSNPVPKLLLHATPGAVIGSTEVDWCRTHAHRTTVVHVGDGLHFLPEDQPARIAEALVDWLTLHVSPNRSVPR